MMNQKSIDKFKFHELDRELIARGAETFNPESLPFCDMGSSSERITMIERLKALYAAPPPRNKEMEHIKIEDIVKQLIQLSKPKEKLEDDYDENRGIIGADERLDFYDLENNLTKAENSHIDIRTTTGKPSRNNYVPEDFVQKAAAIENIKNIKKNYESVAILCYFSDLNEDTENDQYFNLNVVNYRKSIGLCECERFADQFVFSGNSCTAFLVKDDVVATAGHFIDSVDVKQLCVVFGFKMEKPDGHITKILKKNVYRCKELLKKCYKMRGDNPDWGLIRLEQKVTGQEIVKISPREIHYGQPIYTIGYPNGLPLKYAGGASVRNFKGEYLFSADLDIYNGNSGSPVFNANTHEAVGIVIHSYSQNFRYYKNCLISVVYPDPEENKFSELSVCTKISSLIEPLACLE